MTSTPSVPDSAEQFALQFFKGHLYIWHDDAKAKINTVVVKALEAFGRAQYKRGYFDEERDYEAAKQAAYERGLKKSAQIVLELGRDEQRTRDIVDTIRALLPKEGAK